MTRTALTVLGHYPYAPLELRQKGRQQNFGKGHALWVVEDYPGLRLPAFLDEFRGETSVVADCVPATGCMGTDWATHGAIPATPENREALQNAMGTQDKPADTNQLKAGLAKVTPTKPWKIDSVASQSWVTIYTALGGLDAPIVIGDPLGYGFVRGLHARDLQRFCAGYPGEVPPYMYCAINEQPEDAVTTVTLTPYDPPRQGHFAGPATYQGYSPTTLAPHKKISLSRNSGARISGEAVINPAPAWAPGGLVWRAYDGGLAGDYVARQGITVDAPPPPTPPADTTPYSAADLANAKSQGVNQGTTEERARWEAWVANRPE